MSPYDCPDLLPRESFRPWHREEVPKWSLTVSPSWGEGTGSPGKPREPEFTGLDTRKERATQRENSGNLQRVPLQFSPEYKQYRSGLQVTMLGPQIEPKIICVPTSQSGKTS